jgi:hypothetical protein
MNQIVRDLAFHNNPQGYHEPNSPWPGFPYYSHGKPGHGLFVSWYPWGLIWKARSRTIWFMIPLGINMESQVTDYLVHDTIGGYYGKPGHGLFGSWYPWGLIWKARSRTLWFMIPFVTWLSILIPTGIMNQIVRDLAFHINSQGYHEPNSPWPGFPY